MEFLRRAKLLNTDEEEDLEGDFLRKNSFSGNFSGNFPGNFSRNSSRNSFSMRNSYSGGDRPEWFTVPHSTVQQFYDCTVAVTV